MLLVLVLRKDCIGYAGFSPIVLVDTSLRKITQRQLQSSKLRMIVVANGKCDIQLVAGQQLLLLHALREAPAHRVVTDRPPP